MSDILFALLLTFALVSCGLCGLHLFDKLFALLLTFALVLCGLCGLNFYLYVRPASKVYLRFVWASTAYNFVLFTVLRCILIAFKVYPRFV